MQNKDNKFWTLLFLALASGALFSACVEHGGSSATSSSVDRGSFEHRYATERFKQEGYSGSDAQKAADAVIKFNNAQKARQR